MPRFNFASGPKDETGTGKRKTVEPAPAATREAPQDAGPPAHAPEEAIPATPKRSIPLEDVIPQAYREPQQEKFTAPPPTGGTTPGAEVKAAPLHRQGPASGAGKPSAEEPTPPIQRAVPPVSMSAASPRTNPTQEETPPTGASPREDTDEDFDNPFISLGQDEYLTAPDELTPEGMPEQKRSILPLLGIAGIVCFLIAVSIVWFFNPYPPLRETMAEFFYGPASSKPDMGPAADGADEAVTAGDAAPSDDALALADSLEQQAAATRDWNYYLQIAAFPELYRAQDDANRLRKLGLNAKVEGEFIPSQRRTYYRVRLGPFPSAYAAAMKGDSLKGVIPASSFIDSIRVEADVMDTAAGEPPIMQPVLRKPSRPATVRSSTPAAGTQPGSAGTSQPPAKPLPEAAAGFAVHVASFTTLSTAQDESRNLIGRGLPAYTSKSVQGGTAWYRVLVGPFRTRAEAERYLAIVKEESGSSAYVRQLGN